MKKMQSKKNRIHMKGCCFPYGLCTTYVKQLKFRCRFSLKVKLSQVFFFFSEKVIIYTYPKITYDLSHYNEPIL